MSVFCVIIYASAAEISAPEATDSTAKDEFAATQMNVKSIQSQKKCPDTRELGLEWYSFTVQVSPILPHLTNASPRLLKNQYPVGAVSHPR